MSEQVKAEAVETVEEQNTVVNTQVDAEELKQNQDVNWARANDTMSLQARELKELKTQLSELKHAQAKAKEKGLFDGRDGDDIITVDDFNKALKEKEMLYNSQLAELKAQSKYKDYAEVLNKYGKTLPAAMIDAIKTSRNPHEKAYVFCKNSPEYIKDHQKIHENVNRINENLSKPGNASAAGSEAVITGSSKYRSMSRNDIMALHRKFAAGS